MLTCGIESVRRRGASVAAIALLLAGAAFAEEGRDDGQETSAAVPRASIALGVNIYAIDGPYDNAGVSGFWDQSRHIPGKNDSPPFFIDVMQLDAGLVRDDDTYLLRLERFSPNALNDRAEFEVDWKGLGLDVDYQRYRSDSLRFFPRGTYQDQTPPIFAPFGTQYTPDLGVSELFESDRRFWIRRIGVGGELRLRPEGFGFDNSLIRQIGFHSSYQQREGWRQDSFLLTGGNEPAPETSRFRGNRRRVDQEVVNVGGGIVLSTGRAFNADLDVTFESFAQNAKTVTFADIAANDPDMLLSPPTGNQALRAFGYVPDTHRISGTFRANSELGPLSLNGSVFVTNLEQTDRTPLQETLGLKKNEVTTFSVQAAFDVDAHPLLNMNGFFKFVKRDNRISESDFPPVDVTDPDSGSSRTDPILESREELNVGVELTSRPLVGALVAAGYRLDHIDRNLLFQDSDAEEWIDPGVNLQNRDSMQHAVYLRGRWRLLRTGHLRGEVGYLHASQVDYPRDFEDAVYFKGRGSYTFRGRVPVTLGLFGEVIDGNSRGIRLGNANTVVRKGFDRTEYEWGANISALPLDGTTIYASFVHDKDEQKFPYVRTDIARYDGPEVVDFFLDSDVTFDTEVHTLVLGGRHQLTKSIGLWGSVALTWIEANFPDSGSTSSALEAVNRIDARILSLQTGVDWQAREGLSFGAGYRYLQYDDDAKLDPIDRDSTIHRVTLRMTVDLDLFAAIAKH